MALDWSEKDCTGWAKEYLQTSLSGVKLDDAGVARTTEVAQCTGDVLLVRSHGRAKAVYDLCVTLHWEAGSQGADGEVKARGLLQVR